MIALFGVWDFGGSFREGFAEGDWHSGWVETSVVMALEPDLVRMDQLELDPEPLLNMQIEHPDNYQIAEKIVDDKFVVPRMRQNPDIKVGVMGYPERASAETGKQIVTKMVDEVSEKINDLESRADGVYKRVTFNPLPLVFDEPSET